MILIVDDHPFHLAPLIAEIESIGFETRVVSTPDECITLLAAEERIEAILLDVVLPFGSLNPAQTNYGLDTGLVLLREIRNTHPNLPIFLHSARNDLTAPHPADPLTFVLPRDRATLQEIVQSIAATVKAIHLAASAKGETPGRPLQKTPPSRPMKPNLK